MTTHDEDGALIRLVLAGQADYFAILMDRHLAAVRRRIGSLVRNAADAEDLLQEVLLKVWIHLSTFRSESSFRTWMTRIAINEVLQLFRRERCRHVSWGRYDFDTLDSAAEATHEVLAQGETTQAVRNAVARLPANYRQVLILRDLEELSGQETARSLHLSITAVKTRLRRARMMLRAALGSSKDTRLQTEKQDWLPLMDAVESR